MPNVCLQESEGQVRVGNRLLQCSTETSAFWEMIPITHEADAQIGEGNASNRPTDIRMLCIFRMLCI